MPKEPKCPPQQRAAISNASGAKLRELIAAAAKSASHRSRSGPFPVLVAPDRTAQELSRTEPKSTEIGEPVTVGWIAKDAKTGASTKSEVLVGEWVETPSRAIEADPQNEPHLGIFARSRPP